MKSRKSFLLRISPALYEQLEAWAQQEMRSVNGQIEFLLKEAVKRRGRSKESDHEESSHPQD
ncbi:MAG: toxin-antitoxin system HicB family antitoxin [Pirellulaceae bacterium]|nr:toxin-antitoxin system HicB family antitoxin [Pirellulaceae bacterium]